MKKLITISILTALAGVAVASAQPDAGAGHHGDCGGRGGFGMHKLEKLDQNQDGKVTRAEMLSRATERFDKADANKDGKVTPEERQASFQQFAEQRFVEQDKNKDGALSADELPPHFAKRSEKLDTNKDGKLTRAELKAFADQYKGRHFGGHFGGDETRTRADLVAHVEKRFEKLDANKDGALTQDELAKGHHGRHGFRHGPRGEQG
jgi:Ca2+-binding EF-hand superfamily protein